MYSFEEVIGHDDIIDHMKNAFQLGKVSHAYILEGERGMGKKLLSHCFVKLLQCESPDNGAACGLCSSCVQIESGNHPDVIHVTPSKKSGYGVDDVRDQIVKDISVKPYKSNYKIYVIDDAERMTEQAQNSLLKTIEEPPEYGVFFLLAVNAQKFLQTILSRTVKITLKPISLFLIEDYLVRVKGLDKEKAAVFSSFARGNLGKAVDLYASQAFNSLRNDMVKCLNIFINQSEYDIMEAVNLFEGHKEDVNNALEMLISIVRDVLYYIETEDTRHLIHQDLDMQIMEFGKKAKAAQLVRLVKNSYDFLNWRHLNVNYTLSVLTMLTDI